ncbi:MAG TPA: hypothetical protein VFD06_11425 [Candidatus Polarisedimenticolia bacterium]|nr:hypothetical protein [Candidatus Polarisedimenticolia bacterium]
MTQVETAPPPRSMLRSVRRALLLMVVLALLGLVLYTWVAWSFTYSEGERAGYVQKFSKKGWICKTWEGELAMANLPGAMPELFRFTVHDDAVAAEINQAMGERVSIHYEQHLGLPTSCFGDTSHFVVQVRPVTP